MRLRSGVFAIVAVVAFCAATVGSAADAAGTAAGTRLRAFAGCPSFLAYVRQHAVPLVGPWGLAGGAVGPGLRVPPTAARDAIAGAKAGTEVEFSGTNVQEEGVDEPDLVKTDGRTLFVVSATGVSAIDVRSRKPRVVGSQRLQGGGAIELLLHGKRLLVLSQGAPIGIPIDAPAGIRAPWPYPARTTITELDVSEPSRMRIVRTLELEGGYLTARLVGRTVRIVLSSPMAVDLPYVRPVGAEPGEIAQSTERNRNIVKSASVRTWLPGYTLKSARGRVTAEGAIVQCRNVRRPQSFAGLGLLTVVTIDADRGLDPVDSDAVVSDGRVVYASKSRLYVATDRWDKRLQDGRPVPGEASTAIHAFDVASPTQTHYLASGVVPGVLFGQWSLSERNGILRVASTEQPVWWGGPRTESETSVTTLGERAGALVPLGRVGGLGKGERVYAVRFIGDVGYVVTFRQVDPLYTLDLSQPARPVVRGELKIRGYSAYLHPVGDDLLLGIGQDATDEGRLVGAQASLFDVSDLRSPKRLDALSLGKGWSEAEQTHHAFLWWPKTRLAVLPLQSFGESPFAGALGLRVQRAGGISVAGRVTHPTDLAPGGGVAIRRSVVVGDVLYTVSDVGVLGSSLGTFADLGFAPLPAP
jgi:uncharacterized secreted protein with C-terminal beta-propeller domain